jgi:hypothetical protein
MRARIEPDSLVSDWDQRGACVRVCAREQGHVVAKFNERIRKMGNDTFRAAVQFRWDRLVKWCNLRDFHEFASSRTNIRLSGGGGRTTLVRHKTLRPCKAEDCAKLLTADTWAQCLRHRQADQTWRTTGQNRRSNDKGEQNRKCAWHDLFQVVSDMRWSAL